jgi:hypothetical protein
MRSVQKGFSEKFDGIVKPIPENVLVGFLEAAICLKIVSNNYKGFLSNH